MNLLDLAVKITCDDQASKDIEGVSTKAKSNFSGIAAVAGAALAAAAAAVATGVATLTTAAVQSYSQYQQLVGGVDTLFKESSGKLQEYAANAYKTAGTSANQYMQIATSFSASLIQSLGGDTSKAVEYVNTAVQDMSDNANKMGTDINLIQETYQSLARGNYAMLDNLKLGYGGTKAELERMIEDANKMKESMGEAGDLSASSFSDVIEAIHLVQDNLGITGTTALEAATTIEGSINQTKAAWENWLAGLANPDADMGALTSQLVDSASVAVSNLAPAIGQALVSVGEMITTYIPQVFGEAWASVSDSLPLDLGERLSALFEIFQTVFDNVSQSAQSMLGPAFEQLGSAFQGLMEVLSPATPIVQMLGSALSLIGTIIGQIIVSAISLAIQIFTMLISIITGVIEAFNSAASGASAFVSNVIGFFSGLPGTISGFLNSIISSIVGWVSSIASQAISAGQRFLSGIQSGFNSAISFIGSIPGRIVSALGNLGGLLVNAGKSILDGLLSGLQAGLGQITGFFSNLTSMIPSWKGPEDVDRVLLTRNGQLIMESLLNGFESGWSDVENFLTSKTADISTSFNPEISSSSAGVAQASASSLLFDIYNMLYNILEAIPQDLKINNKVLGRFVNGDY